MTAKKGRKSKNRQAKKSQQTRQTLVSAARDVFADKGMSVATIDDITNRADLGKGTFYYHFKNKNGIIKALMRQTLDELTSHIEERCKPAEGLEECLDLLIVAHLEFFDKRWKDYTLYFQGLAELTMAEGYDGLETPFIGYLQEIGSYLNRYIEYTLDQKVLENISCAVAGLVSGYYSFSVIASDDNNMLEAMKPMQIALVAGLTRFIKESIPKGASLVRW
ncbi:MAG: TetR/AcrR family transcriptional regulator [Candidatus Zixiibacteriota bacterium]